jgi:hypothetical protein
LVLSCSKEFVFMARLTDADRRAFSREVLEVLRQNAARLSAAGFDVTGRVTELGSANQTADVKEAAQLTAQQAAVRATQESSDANDHVYDLASASVNLIEGILGKDDPLVISLRQLRPGMHVVRDEAPKP